MAHATRFARLTSPNHCAHPTPPLAQSGVRGVVTLKQAKTGGAVTLKLRVTGVSPNSVHGFHVHALGNLSNGCVSAGGHFNPTNAPHGGPTDPEGKRHAGDLGNVTADAEGTIEATLVDGHISLTGESSVIGRALVLHADPDDLGRGGFPDSLTTGHAGARIACGVVGLDADTE